MTQQNRAGSQAEALRRMGGLIAARRRALGLTQKQLAARLLVSDKAVSKWELGGGYPDPALLAPLAAALDLTVDELLAGRQAETEKVSGPLPEQTTPGREQGTDPAAVQVHLHVPHVPVAAAVGHVDDLLAPQIGNSALHGRSPIFKSRNLIYNSMKCDPCPMKDW